MKKYLQYINGLWVENKETFLSYNKANGQAINEFCSASPENVDEACKAARAAAKIWAGMDADSRAEYMMKAASIMRSRQREMAELEAAETGKPVYDTYNFDTRVSIWAFEYFANLAKEIKGEVIPLGDINYRDFDFVTYEPYGVAAIIAPYNFPLHLLTRSLAPALAAGNTCVMKAASVTPSTTAIMAEIFEEAGFPAGTVNVLHGPGSTVGSAIVSHKEVDVIGFTGSEAVGRELMRLAASSPVIKKCVLELGGKGPAIVEPDADLEIATTAQIEGFTFNQGEVCCAITRVILHEDIYDQYLELLAKKCGEIKIGDPLDFDTRMGALISEGHLQKVDAYVKEAAENGAGIYYGGKRYVEGACKDGPFYMPTIITGVSPDSRICQEEVFGPVLSVMKYKTTEEAIELANNTSYGLGANIFTENLKKAWWIGQQLNAGSVWVNLPNGMHMACPFGGNKNSGQGREYGTYGLHEYLKIKNNMWRMH
ncbi:MAG TPA: aldehyde dehydrogenase family protein [Anaerovoracaceae bacterium]|nr:aldehyde dehydrogenase family protein [Anaerovoracaceae bacterium]